MNALFTAGTSRIVSRRWARWPCTARSVPLALLMTASSIATSSTAQEPKSPDASVPAGQTMSVPDATTSSEGIQESPVTGRASDMPPVAPQLSYIDGKLTIVAENCSLGDILAAVRKLTGAHIVMPAKGSEERMAARLGPGTPRDVLTEFLSSTKFNFIVQAADDDPNQIQSILLMPRSKSQNKYGSNVRTGPSFSERRPVPRRTETSESSNTSEAEPSVPSQPAADSAANYPVNSAPAAGDPPAVAPAPSTTGADLKPAAAPAEDDSQSLSPSEQMMQGLRRMYEQRRQMQQEQNSKPSQTNPPQ